MSAFQLYTAETFTPLTCSVCACRFAVLESMKDSLRNNKNTFWCPNGHTQWFPGETELQKTQRRLEFEQNRRIAAETAYGTARRAESIARGKLKAQTERVRNGVCPCCNRSFQNLKRHMKTKHPEMTP